MNLLVQIAALVALDQPDGVSFMFINYVTAKNAREAFDLVILNVTSEKLKSYGIEAKVEGDKNKECIKADGKGFNFTLEFGQSNCKVNLELSLLLKPFKNKIEEKICAEIKRLL